MEGKQVGKPMQLIQTLSRMFGFVPGSDEIGSLPVYRTIAGAGSVQDPLDRRIVELGDGRSIGEIIEILCREETRSGGSVVYFRPWKGLYGQCLSNTIGQLRRLGYLRLTPSDISYGEDTYGPKDPGEYGTKTNGDKIIRR